MLNFRADALILSARPLGEADAVVDIFAAEQGRRAGVVKGGASRRLRPILQPGDSVQVEWRARLEEHLGAMRVEPLRARAPALMGDADALAALASVCGLLRTLLPEAEPHPALYAGAAGLLDLMAEGAGWLTAYARWELDLLAELGFGLDLSACAATGARDDLVWVSPKTGRAVSRKAGAAYADRLLSLPGFLIGEGALDMAGALALTGWFLEHRVAHAFGLERLPAARARLVARVSRGRHRPA